MRVAVTTAADGLDRVAEAFRRHGLDPVALPCIVIEPAADHDLERIRALATTADRVLVTSARAVDIVWPEAVPRVPFLSVGSRTSEAVTRAGGTVLTEGTAGAADLVSRLEVAGLRIVFPHAAGADPVTAEILRRRGATIDAIPAYRSVPTGPGPDEVDAVAFASPSAVEGWCLTRSLDGAPIAAIGPTTSAAVEERGGRVSVMPATPGFEEMAEALHHATVNQETT